MSARTDHSKNSVQLSAIVVADDEVVRTSLMEHVGVSRRMSRVVDARDSVALRHELAMHHYDLAILMLEDADERLPACLLRYPDLRVLVVVPQRKVSSLELCLQQGASEVVSLQKPATLRHALSRLVDECRLIAELHQANEKIELQQRIHNAIMSNHPHGVMLRCENALLDANDTLLSLLDADQPGNDSKKLDHVTDSWERWLSPASRTAMASLSVNSDACLEVISLAGERYQVRVHPVRFPDHSVQLISIDPEPLTAVSTVIPSSADLGPNLTPNLSASASSIPAGEPLKQRLKAFLGSTLTAGRYTAMLVQFPELESTQTGDGVERTLQELAINRAHDALKRCFPGKTLLARASRSALLLVSPANNRPSRSAANYAHEVLGSLGGLTDADSGIKINTLTVPPTSVNANEMIRRLGSRARPASSKVKTF